MLSERFTTLFAFLTFGNFCKVLSIMAGGVTEWFKVAVLKTAVPQGTGGSNPSSSVDRFGMGRGWDEVSCESGPRQDRQAAYPRG
jgi:hypothetical protein